MINECGKISYGLPLFSERQGMSAVWKYSFLIFSLTLVEMFQIVELCSSCFKWSNCVEVVEVGELC